MITGPYRSRINLVSPDGVRVDSLIEFGTGSAIDAMRWYQTRIRGEVLLVTLTGARNGTYVVYPNGTVADRFSRRLGYYDAFAPDGRFVVFNDIDRTGYGVLFLAQVQDALFIGPRQLTAP
jgi:hypothetical protein